MIQDYVCSYEGENEDSSKAPLIIENNWKKTNCDLRTQRDTGIKFHPNFLNSAGLLLASGLWICNIRSTNPR